MLLSPSEMFLSVEIWHCLDLNLIVLNMYLNTIDCILR